jgi:hypothetical protein
MLQVRSSRCMVVWECKGGREMPFPYSDIREEIKDWERDGGLVRLHEEVDTSRCYKVRN